MELDANAELCRMCLDDVGVMTEYYTIDESLGSLIQDLTKISITTNDSFPKNCCPTCYGIIEKFSNTVNGWVENQLKLQEGLADNCSEEEYLIVKTEEVVKGLEAESPDLDSNSQELDVISQESQDQFEINEIPETNEDEATTEIPMFTEIIEESKSEVQSDDDTESPAKSTDNRERNREIYRKLLKECPECGKMIERNRFDGHMNKHKDLRPYVCESEGCGKAFYCKLLRRLHQTTIHTGKTINCPDCDKSFPSERALYAHSMRHKKRDMYVCNFCDKKFNNSNSLNRHRAIHSGVREFSCDLCSSSFYRKFNLDVHIKAVHNKEKSYSCTYCPKKFAYSRLLKDHVKKSHEISDAPSGEYVVISVS